MSVLRISRTRIERLYGGADFKAALIGINWVILPPSGYNDEQNSYSALELRDTRLFFTSLSLTLSCGAEQVVCSGFIFTNSLSQWLIP